ncbi:hypothetical protein GC177_05695 [bacterium]|nr:hypothetical protein [bacterium]
MLQQFQQAIGNIIQKPHPQQKMLQAIGDFLDTQPEGAAKAFLTILLAMEMKQNIKEGDGLLAFVERSQNKRPDGQLLFLPSEQEIIWRYIAGVFAEADKERLNANRDEPFLKRNMDNAADAIGEHPGVAAKAFGFSVLMNIIPIFGPAMTATLIATGEARRVLAEGNRKFAGDMWQASETACGDIASMADALSQFIQQYKSLNHPDVVTSAMPEQQVHLQQRT